MSTPKSSRSRASTLFAETRPLKFDERLVLNQWMLWLFDKKSFEQLAEPFKSADLEGLNEDNNHKFLAVFRALWELDEFPGDILLGYDKHFLGLQGKSRELNRIILLTPNEGLSKQHLAEFHAAGLDADLFSKDGKSLFAGKTIEIIDIHKLREDTGEKTVAIDAFEGNNLVLVDEGHRGSSGKEAGRWMDARKRLCEHGFSFEYSATFGQAMKASGDKALEPKGPGHLPASRTQGDFPRRFHRPWTEDSTGA